MDNLESRKLKGLSLRKKRKNSVDQSSKPVRTGSNQITKIEKSNILNTSSKHKHIKGEIL
jgi:hypothetical protein